MALTYSEQIPLGEKAKPFELLDVYGNKQSLASLQSPIATVVMFICNHCPYVVAIQDQIAQLARDYQAKGVSFIAICSNDSKRYPADSVENLRAQAERVGFNFSYLIDSTQEVAKAYDAVCTPDFFVFDSEMKLAYRARLQEMSAALDSLLDGKAVNEKQTPSMGCSIKWL